MGSLLGWLLVLLLGRFPVPPLGHSVLEFLGEEVRICIFKSFLSDWNAAGPWTSDSYLQITSLRKSPEKNVPVCLSKIF